MSAAWPWTARLDLVATGACLGCWCCWLIIEASEASRVLGCGCCCCWLDTEAPEASRAVGFTNSRPSGAVYWYKAAQARTGLAQAARLVVTACAGGRVVYKVVAEVRPSHPQGHALE